MSFTLLSLALGFFVGVAIVLALWVAYMCHVNGRLMDELSGCVDDDDDDDDDDPESRPLVPFSPQEAMR